jgi:hypothetical protein
MLVLAPAERIDAVVEMNNPEVWVFGSIKDDERSSGLGIVIEYANATGDAQWRPMEKAGMPMWDYLKFGANAPARERDGRFELLSQKILGGRGGFNRWTINGKSWPDTEALPGERPGAQNCRSGFCRGQSRAYVAALSYAGAYGFWIHEPRQVQLITQHDAREPTRWCSMLCRAASVSVHVRTAGVADVTDNARIRHG